MSAGKARLTAAAIVFVGWLLFLIWLAWTAGKPTVVSRPQFLVAHLYVVAELQDGTVHPAPVKVRLPSVLAIPQPGWPTSLPWGGLVQIASSDPKLLPPLLEVPVEVVGDGPFEEVKVKEVLWSGDGDDRKGTTLFVHDLRLCDEKYGWQGPGMYVLALTKKKTRTGFEYRVASVPRSPGYEPPGVNDKVRMAPALIYRDAPDVRHQVHQIIKMYHGN